MNMTLLNELSVTFEMAYTDFSNLWSLMRQTLAKMDERSPIEG